MSLKNQRRLWEQGYSWINPNAFLGTIGARQLGLPTGIWHMTREW